MGIFNKLSGGKDPFEIPNPVTASDLQKAIAILGIHAIGSDGHFDKNEIVDLQNTMIGMPVFKSVGEPLGQAERMFDKDKRRSLDWAVDVVKGAQWEKTAFVFSCSLVFSDGDLDPDEAAHIDKLSSMLSLQTNFIEAVADTFSSLYRSS